MSARRGKVGASVSTASRSAVLSQTRFALTVLVRWANASHLKMEKTNLKAKENNMFGSRKLGYFEISEKALQYLDLIHEILDQVVILKAEFHFDDMRMYYFGIGPFEDVDARTIAPHYNIECQDFVDGKPLIFVKGNKAQELNWLELKLYNCLTCYDEQTVTCSKCNGSGEGMSDDSHCTVCKNGSIRCPDCGMEDV